MVNFIPVLISNDDVLTVLADVSADALLLDDSDDDGNDDDDGSTDDGSTDDGSTDDDDDNDNVTGLVSVTAITILGMVAGIGCAASVVVLRVGANAAGSITSGLNGQIPVARKAFWMVV